MKKEVILQKDGMEIIFSEEMLIILLEYYFENQVIQKKNNEVVQKPTEDQWFKVDPVAINSNLFLVKRKDQMQEWTRKIILEALAEVKKNPQKYARPFETLRPKKTWILKTVQELKELAQTLGDHMADWVEQALEWAQRISNGEEWENVCNQEDTANWYRLIVWKNGFARIVGCSLKDYDYYCSATDVDSYNLNSYFKLSKTVPLVVRYCSPF